MYKTTGTRSRGIVVVLLVIIAMVATLAPSDTASASQPAQPDYSEPTITPVEPAPVLPAARMAACALETTVSTATELDDAIDCYNAQMPAGSHTITLGTSFTHPSGTPAITQNDTAFSLTIQGVAGQNRTITGPGAATLGATLFTVAGSGPVTFQHLTIAEAQAHGISVFANTVVTVRNSTLRDNGLVGIIAFDGLIEVLSSTVIGNFDGVVAVTNAIFAVSNSTVTANTERGFFLQSADDDLAGILVTNSTVTGNNIGATSQLARMSFVSSVLDNTTDCAGAADGFGDNFASDDSCPGFSSLRSRPPLPLADNGGPTQTQELPPYANALGGGDCLGVIVGVDAGTIFTTGDLLNDQRGPGFTRTIGANCDAGSFEATLPPLFSDISLSSFYADSAIWAATNLITTGTGDGTTFTPNGVVTRAQIATFLWRAAGRPDPTGTNPFTDVPPGKFFSDAVVWLAEVGVTSGTGDGTTFSPNAPVNRAQIATFLWRFAGAPAPAAENPFTDVPDGKFFTVPVTWLAETGVTTGTGDGTTFSPNAPVTRAQAVTFLHRFAQLPPPPAVGMEARDAAIVMGPTGTATTANVSPSDADTWFNQLASDS